ncbi:hypothetical protein LJC12_05540 [Odoribacter sp. OttesenSCG-928-J03]|nr:hypothetical protein [Odoribacter sp. OttesenSCG-928-J03]MDL2283128.1 hypothetical protein [Odoribacter sp. OttesenSCG-928-G04]MDL2330484.1 hypothetical protein [Odoribacter sp. OttesenSCG-928-A06]
MKFRSLFLSVLCMVMMGLSFSACSDDDDDKGDEGSVVELPGARAFILNEGTYEGNNSGITFYAPNGDADKIDDIYHLQNNERLGDTGQDILNEDSDIFVIVAGSKRLVKLNKSGVKQAELSFAGKFGDPRYMAEEDGKLYVTTYGDPGYVLRIDTKTLTVEDSVAVGFNPENIVESEDKLYVSNTEWGSGTSVSVIDIKTFEVIKKIDVLLNPNDLLEVNDDIYLISWGDYFGDPAGQYVLQCINGKTHESASLNEKASKMAKYNGIIYLVHSTGVENRFFTYNTKTKKFGESFLKNTPAALQTATVYMLKVNPNNGEIYIGTTDYQSNGDIYRFHNDGTLIEIFESGGINPNHAIFFK